MHIHTATTTSDVTPFPSTGTMAVFNISLAGPSWTGDSLLTPEISWVGGGFWMEEIIENETEDGTVGGGNHIPSFVGFIGPDPDTIGHMLLSVYVDPDEVAKWTDTSAFLGLRLHIYGNWYVNFLGV